MKVASVPEPASKQEGQSCVYGALSLKINVEAPFCYRVRITDTNSSSHAQQAGALRVDLRRDDAGSRGNVVATATSYGKINESAKNFDLQSCD